jgi:hypothetical protein
MTIILGIQIAAAAMVWTIGINLIADEVKNTFFKFKN